MNLQTILWFCCAQMTVHVFASIPNTSFCSSPMATPCSPPEPSSNCPTKVTKCLNVLWTDFKPYSYLVPKTKEFRGIIPGIFNELISKCCGGCWKVNVTGRSVSRQSVTAGIFPSDVDIVLPFHSSSDEKKKEQGMYFVSLVESPAVVYVTKKESASAIPRKLIGAVWNAWPVLIIALILSLVSGTLLWFLEFWRNPDEFPPSFFTGSWEGFWWAFVSMTTVGYGDRAPKSILGRTFAIFWIMIGICICSIFTATLTTSLTTITLEEKKTLARAKVGALRNSLEAYEGVKSGAKVINYNSTKELWSALDNDQVEGIVLDSLFSATPEISAYIESNDYRISQTVEVEGKSYGILVRDANLTNCLREKFENELDDTDDLTEIITKEIDSESSENEAAARSDSIFNPTGDIFWPSLYACIALVVVMLAAGVLWEFFCRGKCQKRTGKTDPCAEVNAGVKLDAMEKELIADVQKLFADWRARCGVEIGIDAPIRVVDVEGQKEQMSMAGTH